MAQSYFIWNGKDCRDMGVKLSGPVPIVFPEERVQHVEIPGRSGDLTETEGEQIYNSYIQTATIMIKGGYRAREIKNWLKGSGFVTFHGEPDKKQAARIIGAVTLNKHSRNLDWWLGEVQFYCQPLKQLLIESPVEITEPGNVYVAGDVQARPKWTVTLPQGQTSFWLASGGKRLDVTGIPAGEYVIDSEIMEVTAADGVALLTPYSTGDFPVLVPGTNTVTGANWSKVVINKRERFL